MQKPSEEKLAKAAYNWLRASPVVTLLTLFMIVSMDIAQYICGDYWSWESVSRCDYQIAENINFAFGVLGSALWHLVLLQYANNKDSEFVRKHGRQALVYAGIRTAVPLGAVVLNFLTGESGLFSCLAIGTLLILWFALPNTGMAQIKRELENDPSISREFIQTRDTSPSNEIISVPIQMTSADREKVLGEILNGLQSENDETVLNAIANLNRVQESNETILKELETLADEDENMDIRIEARVALNALKQHTSSVNGIIRKEVDMNENKKPEEVLEEILAGLRSNKSEDRANAITQLNSINFSSEAIRRELEILARKDEDSNIRANALAALNSPSSRMVQKRINSNKLDRGTRYVLINEINEWVKSDLLETQTADLLRRRYDYDFEAAPQTAPKPATVHVADANAEAKAPEARPAAPMERREPVPEGPRPSLLQTLTSEAAIRIYLYLGAFFVIAAATFVGAAVPSLRLPILIIGTLIFGGLAIVIKKRLPQPSFALFIVFSFLLTITADNIEQTMRTTFNFTETFSAGYWVAVYFIMALVWSGSTWLYESRLFSITAFGALTLSLLRIGDLFDSRAELYTVLAGIAALAGLGAVWLTKKWRDEKFALPLFIAVLAVQGINLLASISIFGTNIVNPSNPPLWHLAAFFVWGLAVIFFILAHILYPFFAFPWLAAGALIPIPWFLAAAFDLETLGSTIVLVTWGAVLSVASEVLQRIERTQKYSLPVLLASIPAFGLGLITSFAHAAWLGMLAALVSAVLFTTLHILRTRWWLWTLALLNFAFAYFGFFNTEIIKQLDIFIGYQVLGISILFLLPDLLLKKDWTSNPEWRLPLRGFGALFTAYTSLALLFQNESAHVAVCYAILTVFLAVYALAYRQPLLGYIPAATLPLVLIFALDALEVDAWLPALTTLAIFYFVFGLAIRAKENWSFMLRNSALVLGTLASFAALVMTKETGGWYALIIGLLFIAEMYLRRNGWFEIGAPILFNIGVFLILRDFDVFRETYHLLAYSLVWIVTDLLAHLTFTNPRPLSIITRGIGGLLTGINYLFLFAESDVNIATMGFAVYTLLALTVSLVYRQSKLFYAFTLTLPLFVTFLFRIFDVTKWIHPVIVLAVLYYAAGIILRAMKRAEGWDEALLYSGLGVGVIVSIAAPFIGGLDAALPVAIAATLWAVEAFAKRSAWLAFPANGLYLLSYFIILGELNVAEPQFYSIGAALLGLIQHYLLVRAESKAGAFIMGMLSQFVLLGTTYIQMLGELNYFFLLFLQSMAVLIYGIVIRSRSMTFFPIGFVVLGVFTSTFLLSGVGVLLVIGCTGILLLGFGIAAVLLRERISKLGERMSDWKP
jgi:hypothetical protein